MLRGRVEDLTDSNKNLNDQVKMQVSGVLHSSFIFCVNRLIICISKDIPCNVKLRIDLYRYYLQAYERKLLLRKIRMLSDKSLK